MQPRQHQRVPSPCIGGQWQTNVISAASGDGALADTPRDAAAAGNHTGELAAKARTALQQKQRNTPFVGKIWELQASLRDQIVADFDMMAPETVFTDADGRAVFSSDDAANCFEIQVLRGNQKVMWMTSPRTMLGQLALGGRVNAYVSSNHSCAPNLDMELYHYPLFGKLFMYLNLTPRRSLIEHPEDVERFYLDTPAESGKTYQALYEACEEKLKSDAGGWERFVSRDVHVRALTGGTCLMYQMDATEDNMAEVEQLARQVHAIWTALVRDAPPPQGGREAEALERTDRNLLAYSRRDPDAGKAAAFLGQQGLEDMLALLCREDRIFTEGGG